ncbi:monocarboxylate transporter 7-like [Pholidichthys leucotaenia]
MAACSSKLTRFLGPNVYSEAPDGGWGWAIAVAFFLVEVFTYGTIKIFGIFLQDLMDEFNETNSQVSWIVSISVFVMTFNGPFSSMLTNRFGFQSVVMMGGFLLSAGVIATSFTTSINQMYITYGLVAGAGYCLTFLPTVTILSQYFNHRRALVISVASIGEPLSIFSLAPACSALKDHIGWRHTMAVIGGLQSIIILCGALLRPIIIKPRDNLKAETDSICQNKVEAQSETKTVKDKNQVSSEKNNASCEANAFDKLNNELTRHSASTGDSGVHFRKDTEEISLMDQGPKLEPEEGRVENSATGIKESEQVDIVVKDAQKQVMGEQSKSGDKKLLAKNPPILDFSILRECSFIFYSLFGLFATLGFFAPQLYIIELSVSRGVERDRAAYMLSTMAVAEILGRFSIGWILTRKKLRSRKLLVLLACVISMTVDLLGFTMVTEFYGLIVCCGVYGFFMGTLASTHIPMLAEDDVVGIERMSSAAGVYVFIHSFAGLGGPPLGGLLVDITQNYGSAFYSCAAGMGLSALFLGLVRPAKRGLLCKKKRQPEGIHEREVNHQEHSGEQDTRNDILNEGSRLENLDNNQAEAMGDCDNGVSPLL